jgi:hypothetical protein
LPGTEIDASQIGLQIDADWTLPAREKRAATLVAAPTSDLI